MIGIIDYGAGNIRSLSNSLENLGVPYIVSNDSTKLQRADKLILPGVGEARSAMNSLYSVGLIEWLRGIQQPFLGICLGMQLLFDRSTESSTECLGVIAGQIQRFSSENLKVPHMGWNRVVVQKENPLFASILNNEYFYFVHSYYAPIVNETVSETMYGTPFSSALRKNNFYGVQFHPEKSGTCGLQLLRNFVEIC